MADETGLVVDQSNLGITDGIIYVRQKDYDKSTASDYYAECTDDGKFYYAEVSSDFVTTPGYALGTSYKVNLYEVDNDDNPQLTDSLNSGIFIFDTSCDLVQEVTKLTDTTFRVTIELTVGVTGLSEYTQNFKDEYGFEDNKSKYIDIHNIEPDEDDPNREKWIPSTLASVTKEINKYRMVLLTYDANGNVLNSYTSINVIQVEIYRKAYLDTIANQEVDTEITTTQSELPEDDELNFLIVDDSELTTNNIIYARLKDYDKSTASDYYVKCSEEDQRYYADVTCEFSIPIEYITNDDYSIYLKETESEDYPQIKDTISAEIPIFDANYISIKEIVKLTDTSVRVTFRMEVYIRTNSEYILSFKDKYSSNDNQSKYTDIHDIDPYEDDPSRSRWLPSSLLSVIKEVNQYRLVMRIPDSDTYYYSTTIIQVEIYRESYTSTLNRPKNDSKLDRTIDIDPSAKSDEIRDKNEHTTTVLNELSSLISSDQLEETAVNMLLDTAPGASLTKSLIKKKSACTKKISKCYKSIRRLVKKINRYNFKNPEKIDKNTLNSLYQEFTDACWDFVYNYSLENTLICDTDGYPKCYDGYPEQKTFDKFWILYNCLAVTHEFRVNSAGTSMTFNFTRLLKESIERWKIVYNLGVTCRFIDEACNELPEEDVSDSTKVSITTEDVVKTSEFASFKSKLVEFFRTFKSLLEGMKSLPKSIGQIIMKPLGAIGTSPTGPIAVTANPIQTKADAQQIIAQCEALMTYVSSALILADELHMKDNSVLTTIKKISAILTTCLTVAKKIA